MKKHIKTYISGFLMGCAEIVPGVSGSTIALILGIYDNFINILFSISEIVKTILLLPTRKVTFADVITKIKAFEYSFSIILVLGMITAIGLLSGGIVKLLEVYPHYLFAVLLGLVISVSTLPIKVIKKPTLLEAFVAVASFVALFYILGFSTEESGVKSDPSLIFLFFGGVVGISSMILPGISGSFILLVLGLYYYIVATISDVIRFDATTQQYLGLVAFSLGMFTGFVTVVQVIKRALDNHLRIFLAFVLGLLLASTRVLWPFVESVKDGDEIATRVVSLNAFSSTEIALIVVIFTVTTIVFGVMNWKYAEV